MARKHWQQYGRSRRSSLHGAAVNLFVDDYRLESLWRRGPGALALADVVTLPDFSVAWDTPFPVAHYQWYRAAVVGELLADAGVRVLPLLSFTSEAVADVAPGSVVACRVVPRGADFAWTERWTRRFGSALSAIEPARVILFGAPVVFLQRALSEVTGRLGITYEVRALHSRGPRHKSKEGAAQNPRKRLQVAGA